MKLYQGYFKPKNPQKYKGDPSNIIYRSGWELKLMLRLDEDKQIISWGSEEIIIPYRSPIDGKIHRYYPDFIVTKINKDNVKETVIIEIKPAKQTQPPARQEKMTRRYLTEVKTWGTNEAKWKAASEYCKDRGWKFVIFTEKELGITY
jgi:hypothetical protein